MKGEQTLTPDTTPKDVTVNGPGALKTIVSKGVSVSCSRILFIEDELEILMLWWNNNLTFSVYNVFDMSFNECLFINTHNYLFYI